MIEPYRRGRWGLGCLLAFVLGSTFNMLMLMVGMKINMTLVSTILGILPGIGLMIASRRTTMRDFAQGMFVGACIITLLGGICGAAFTATQVGH